MEVVLRKIRNNKNEIMFDDGLIKYIVVKIWEPFLNKLFFKKVLNSQYYADKQLIRDVIKEKVNLYEQKNKYCTENTCYSKLYRINGNWMRILVTVKWK